MIITISGRPGAGKTSLMDTLSYYLKFPAVSAGNLRGGVALSLGLNIDSLNQLGEEYSWTDRDVDNEQNRMGLEDDNFILEGRLSWYFVPNSFKIFLDVQEYIGAERILRSGRQDEIIEGDLDLEVKRLRERISSDCLRYKKWHGIDFSQPKKKWFDCWVDTSFLDNDGVVQEVLHDYSKYLNKLGAEVREPKR